MKWNRVSADRWASTVGDVSVRKHRCDESYLWAVYVGEIRVSDWWWNAQLAMSCAPNCGAVKRQLEMPPIAGSGPPKSMPERRQDGFVSECNRIVQAVERLKVLWTDGQIATPIETVAARYLAWVDSTHKEITSAPVNAWHAGWRAAENRL